MRQRSSSEAIANSEAQREWWLAISEAAGLPGMPTTVRGVLIMAEREGWTTDELHTGAGCASLPARARQRESQGGGWEFHISLLPAEAQAAWIARQQAAETEAAAQARARAEWDRYARLPQKARDEGLRRLAVIERIELLAQAMPLRAAVPLAAGEAAVSASTVWTWWRAASAVARAHRLAALAPRHAGRTATAECHPEAWEFIKADYLRREQPAFDACYRRLLAAAQAQDWSPIPSQKTLRRRLEKEVPRAARVLLRQGTEAAKRTYPHQTRDRAVFHALQAVTADGHTCDVFVRWPDGKVERPVLVAIQDLYSGMIVGHRLDRSESWHAVRLALLDMVSSFGIPECIYLDNGRAFASKWISGGAKTRYRFRVRADEPEGVLTRLGIRINWVSPYHGQAKPIERAFRDLAEEIAKHPRCAGAYTGRSPQHKPDNYGTRAIPIDEFEAHVAEQINRHNRREGRATPTARGRSFHATFNASYEQALIRRAGAHQLHELMLAAEGVTCRKPDGSVYLAENRYWHAALGEHVGRKVVARFDPAALFEPLAVYSLDGRFICAADCVERTGFNDVAAAREHAKKRNDYLRALREARDLEVTMSVDELARLLPPPEPVTPPRPAAVRLVAGGAAPRVTIAAAPVAERDPETWLGSEGFSRAVSNLEGAVLPFRRGGEDDEGGLV